MRAGDKVVVNPDITREGEDQALRVDEIYTVLAVGQLGGLYLYDVQVRGKVVGAYGITNWWTHQSVLMPYNEQEGFSEL